MTSIARRPNGRYRDPSGIEHAKHFARKVDEQRWVDERTAAMVTGQYVDPTAGRVKLRAYAEQLRATMAHGPTTRNLVERTLRRHVYPTLGELPMATIRTSTLQGLMTELAGRLAPSTLKLHCGRWRGGEPVPLVGDLAPGGPSRGPAAADRTARAAAPVRLAADPARGVSQGRPAPARTQLRGDHARHLRAPVAGLR